MYLTLYAWPDWVASSCHYDNLQTDPIMRKKIYFAAQFNQLKFKFTNFGLNCVWLVGFIGLTKFLNTPNCDYRSGCSSHRSPISTIEFRPAPYKIMPKILNTL